MADSNIQLIRAMPLTFRPANPVVIPQYMSKQMDKYKHTDIVPPHITNKLFIQPWQLSDTIRLQYKIDFGPIYLNQYNCKGGRIGSKMFEQKQQDTYNSKMFIWEVDYPLLNSEEGLGYFTLGLGNTNIEYFHSEPCSIYVSQENTLLVQFWHNKFKEGIFFETGIKPELRIPGEIKFNPESSSFGFIDQSYSVKLIYDIAYRKLTLKIGVKTGVPDNFIDKINRVIGCNNLWIDGIQYSKGEGSKLEATEYTNYSLRWWEIDLYEYENKYADNYTNEVIKTTRATILINVDTAGFGTSSGGIVTISDVE